MPISIRSVSRRDFLRYTAAGALAMMASPLRGASRKIDPNRYALMSDTHINADATRVDRKFNMSDQLGKAVEQVLKLDSSPAAVFVNGDCAHRTGEAADYAQFLKMIDPLTQAGLPVHCGLGNHDNRDLFWAAAEGLSKPARVSHERQMLVVRGDAADWIVLDTLDVVNKTPGRLGQAHLDLIKRLLDETLQTKPVLILMHHNPEPTSDPAATQPAKGIIGLLDTKPLLDLIVPRKQVKAVFYGHSHQWKQGATDGIHWINLPAVSYPFAAEQPTGWLDLQLDAAGAKGKLVCIDAASPKHGDAIDLRWR